MSIKYNHCPFDAESLTVEHIERINEDGTVSWIPIDEANSDYQRYLNPEAEQSTPIVTSDE
jgi:hypothetical protein